MRKLIGKKHLGDEGGTSNTDGHRLKIFFIKIVIYIKSKSLFLVYSSGSFDRHMQPVITTSPIKTENS